MTPLSTVDCIVIALLVCVPLAGALIVAGISSRRHRRWRNSTPIDGGRLSGRARS